MFVYDDGCHELLLFGGSGPGETYTNELLSWDGVDPALAGLTVFSQALVAEAGANPTGLVATGALSSAVGIR